MQTTRAAVAADGLPVTVGLSGVNDQGQQVFRVATDEVTVYLDAAQIEQIIEQVAEYGVGVPWTAASQGGGA